NLFCRRNLESPRGACASTCCLREGPTALRRGPLSPRRPADPPPLTAGPPAPRQRPSGACPAAASALCQQPPCGPARTGGWLVGGLLWFLEKLLDSGKSPSRTSGKALLVPAHGRLGVPAARGKSEVGPGPRQRRVTSRGDCPCDPLLARPCASWWW